MERTGATQKMNGDTKENKSFFTVCPLKTETVDRNPCMVRAAWSLNLSGLIQFSELWCKTLLVQVTIPVAPTRSSDISPSSASKFPMKSTSFSPDLNKDETFKSNTILYGPGSSRCCYIRVLLTWSPHLCRSPRCCWWPWSSQRCCCRPAGSPPPLSDSPPPSLRPTVPKQNRPKLMNDNEARSSVLTGLEPAKKLACPPNWWFSHNLRGSNGLRLSRTKLNLEARSWEAACRDALQHPLLDRKDMHAPNLKNALKNKFVLLMFVFPTIFWP